MPSLSGSTQAPLYAQFNVARFGATRFGYTSPKVFVSVDGTQRANGRTDTTVSISDLTITETNNSTPNKATFTVKGTWQPAVGMPVVITLGSANRIRRMFAGSVLNVSETSTGLQRQFRVDCVDWSWELDNSPLVYGKFTGTYDTIATTLMDTYAPTGFTYTQVESGLPTCTGGITFTAVKLSKALDRLQKRARGEGITITKFVDYNKDLYFRQTQSADYTNPQTVTESLDTLRQITQRSDMSQIANRVPCVGGGANALTEVAAGETILPLTDAPDYWYGDTGGTVVSGPQKITYTARVAGGGGSVVGPGTAPSNAPTVALASGSGVDSGAHTLTVVWKTAAGRSLPGPSASITVGSESAPASAPTVGTPTVGAGPDDGVHDYAIAFENSAGVTTVGPYSAQVTTTSVTAPSFTPSIADSTFVGNNGNWTAGDSLYCKVTYATSGGETTASAQSNTLTAVGSHGFTTTVTASSDASVVGIRVYVNKNGSWIGYYEVNNITQQVYMAPAGSLVGTSPPGTNTAALHVVPLANIPLGGATITKRRIYRRSGGAALKLVGTINDNTTTTYSDTVPNASLGASAPSSNTATANQISVSGISIGPSGTTDREVYMSPAGGGTRRLALTIANNTATTGTISMSDATLAGQSAEPGSDTSGLTQPSGQVIPGATTLAVAGTAPFRSAGGWAFTGTQQIRYTGYSGSSLTGIPASGAGSIQQAITYNSTIAAAPCLTGIPSSGDGAILYTIPKGDPVNLYVTADDTTAQATLAARLDDGTDGVRECPPLSDNRLSRTEAITRASALLALRAYPSTTLGPLVSKDVNCRAGVALVVNVTTPHSINDTFQIASVTISNFTQALPPDYSVQASDEWVSVEDVLSRDS